MALSLEFIEQNLAFWNEQKSKHSLSKSILVFDTPKEESKSIFDYPSPTSAKRGFNESIHLSLKQKILDVFENTNLSVDNFPINTWIKKPLHNPEFPLVHVLKDSFYYAFYDELHKAHPEMKVIKSKKWLPKFCFVELEKLLANEEFPRRPIRVTFSERFNLDKMTYEMDEIETYIKSNLPLNDMRSWIENNENYSTLQEYINKHYPYFSKHEAWHIREVIRDVWVNGLDKPTVKNSGSLQRSINYYPNLLIEALIHLFLTKRGQ